MADKTDYQNEDDNYYIVFPITAETHKWVHSSCGKHDPFLYTQTFVGITGSKLISILTLTNNKF